MTIVYQYKIVEVNTQTMRVEYSADTYPTITMGVPLPVAPATVESVISVYAPFGIWTSTPQTYVTPTVGDAGVINPTVVNLSTYKYSKLSELASWRYVKETQGIVVSGNYYLTTRESRSSIMEYYIKLKDQIISSVNFKDGRGKFVILDLEKITQILTSIDTWVNSCFQEEEDFSIQIKSCTTAEEVDAITFPANTTGNAGTIPTVTL